MKKNYLFFATAFALSLCFVSAACQKNDAQSAFKIDKLDFGGVYYQSPYAAATPRVFNDKSASAIVSEIKVGWNLGNTLDAHPGGETSWGNPKTTMENITALKNAGFNAIRIPVTWYSNSNTLTFEIRKEWMDRVTEVVNYAVLNDMYIVLNSHHDEAIFKYTKAQKDASLAAFYQIWSQIAYNFRNYDEKLIFEALNEPRTKGSAQEWSGGTFEEHLIINEHYRLFIKIIRASGGNNDKRIIMLNTYAASAEQTAMNGLVIPEDTVKDKIIVSIHAYSPYDFALNQGRGATDKWSADNPRDTEAVRTPFDRAYETFVKKGYPVILGEFGAVNRDNTSARAAWFEYYIGYGKSKGIPSIIWDNGAVSGSGERFGYFDRINNSFTHPEILDAVMRGASAR